MARIPEDVKEEIRSRLDIVQIASSYMELKRSGVNNFGKCPFPGHAEKTGSFNVNSARQRYHCFGCGEDGDVFELVAQIEGLSFPESVKKLAGIAGIEIREEKQTPADKQREREREWAFGTNTKAHDWTRNALKGEKGQQAREYLAKRGITDDLIEEYMLGFNPFEWDGLVSFLMSNKQSAKICEELGLIKRGENSNKYFDRLRGRIVFPIHTHDGKLVSFAGVAIDDTVKPSFIDLPDSRIFKQDYNLFGFWQAREAIRVKETAIVVRRHLDLFALRRAGFDNVVVPCGGVVQEGHVRNLKRVAKRVIILSASDVNSLKSAFNSLDAFLPQQLSVSYALLDEKESPGYFIAKKGADKLAEVIDAAKPGLEVYMQKVEEVAPATQEGRMKAAERIIDKLKLIVSDIERSLYGQEVARRFNVQGEWVTEQLASR